MSQILSPEDRTKIEKQFEERLYFSSKVLEMRNLLFVGRQQVGKSQAIKTMKNSFAVPGVASLFAKTQNAEVTSFLLQNLKDKQLLPYLYRCVDSCGLFEVAKSENNSGGRDVSSLVENLTACLKKSIRSMHCIFLVLDISNRIDPEDIKSIIIFLNLFNNGKKGVKKALLLTHADKFSEEEFVDKIVELSRDPMLQWVLSENPLEHIVDNEKIQNYKKQVEELKKIHQNKLSMDEISIDINGVDGIEDKTTNEVSVPTLEKEFPEVFQSIRKGKGTMDIDENNNQELIELSKSMREMNLDIISIGCVDRNQCYVVEDYEKAILDNEARKEKLLSYIENAKEETNMDNFPIVQKEARKIKELLKNATEYLTTLNDRLYERENAKSLDEISQSGQNNANLLAELNRKRGLMVLDAVSKEKLEFQKQLVQYKTKETDPETRRFYLHDFA